MTVGWKNRKRVTSACQLYCYLKLCVAVAECRGARRNIVRGGLKFWEKYFGRTKVQATLFYYNIYVIYAISILTHQNFSLPGPAATSVFLCLFPPVTVVLLICKVRCDVVWHFSAKFWHCLWQFVTCLVSRDIVFKSTRMLYSSITSYHFQQILMPQSAIICHEILSTALFSTSQTSKIHALQYHYRS